LASLPEQDNKAAASPAIVIILLMNFICLVLIDKRIAVISHTRNKDTISFSIFASHMAKYE
jgi:hypothetical protein